MDVLIVSTRRLPRGWLAVASITLAAALIAAPQVAAENGADEASDVTVKAAFLYNFAKFAEWSALRSGAPIVVCIVGNEGIAAAFIETVRGQNVSGHALDVWRLRDPDTWRVCNMLFIAKAETGRAAGGLGAIKTLPILTISDGKGFSQTSGIIELFVESGRMRFAINVDAAERSGLNLSSRLLGLAKIIRNGEGK